MKVYQCAAFPEVQGPTQHPNKQKSSIPIAIAKALLKPSSSYSSPFLPFFYAAFIRKSYM